MTNEEALSVLSILNRYELVDITVVSTDGSTAMVDVVYTRDGGDLETARVSFQYMLGDSYLFLEPADEHLRKPLVDEIAAECLEAVLYQRDLLRAKN